MRQILRTPVDSRRCTSTRTQQARWSNCASSPNRLCSICYDCLGISLPNYPKLGDLLEEPTFQHVVPLAVRYKLDAVRIHGNAGAHGRHISEETSLWLLRETFQLVCWFFLAYICREKQPCPEYQTPSNPSLAPTRHARVPAKEETLELLEQELKSPFVTERRADESISYDISEPSPQELLEPFVNLRAMITRRQLREELGTKSQDTVRDTGDKAVAALHLEESPTAI